MLANVTCGYGAVRFEQATAEGGPLFEPEQLSWYAAAAQPIFGSTPVGKLAVKFAVMFIRTLPVFVKLNIGIVAFCWTPPTAVAFSCSIVCDVELNIKVVAVCPEAVKAVALLPGIETVKE